MNVTKICELMTIYLSIYLFVESTDTYILTLKNIRTFPYFEEDKLV